MVTLNNENSTSQILEQIRDIQIQTLRAVSWWCISIMAMVDMDKLQDRDLQTR